MAFLDWLEWETNSRQDHYLARIAYEIKAFRAAFGGDRNFTIKDFLCKFELEGESIPQPGKTTRTVRSKDQIEIGPDAVKDPKWAAVNRMAKLGWGARVGVRELKNVK